MSYVRLAEKRSWTFNCLDTLDCLSFARTATVEDSLKAQKLTESGCYFPSPAGLAVSEIPCRLMFCLSVLPEVMKGQSDWLNCVHFGFEFSRVSFVCESGKASRGKISCCAEAQADFSGLQWNEVGVGYGFPRLVTGTGSRLCRKRGWFRRRVESS